MPLAQDEVLKALVFPANMRYPLSAKQRSLESQRLQHYSNYYLIAQYSKELNHPSSLVDLIFAFLQPTQEKPMLDLQFATIERFFSLVGGVGSLIGLVIFIREKFFRGVTWRQALRDAEKVLTKIEGQHWRPDAVIGLGRSGAIWGGWLAGNLGSLPICVLDREFAANNSSRKIVFADDEETLKIWRKRFGDNAKILVVEGANTSGQPFNASLELFQRVWPGCELKFAALYSNKASPFDADFVGHPGMDPYPEKFPWHLRTTYRANLGINASAPRLGKSA